MALPTAGWYLDSDATATLRWWSGDGWTEHRQPAGATSVLQSVAPAQNLSAWVGLLFAAVSLFANPFGVVSVVAVALASVGLARSRRLAKLGSPFTGRTTAVTGLCIALLSLLMVGVFFFTGRTPL